VCLGPAPVGLEEAVSAVPRNEHRLHAGSDRAGLPGSTADCSAETSAWTTGLTLTGAPDRGTGAASLPPQSPVEPVPRTPTPLPHTPAWTTGLASTSGGRKVPHAGVPNEGLGSLK
jgi:hypothetical protein